MLTLSAVTLIPANHRFTVTRLSFTIRIKIRQIFAVSDKKNGERFAPRFDILSEVYFLGLKNRRRKAFKTTVTEEILIAAAAIIGDSFTPSIAKHPAANGIQTTL